MATLYPTVSVVDADGQPVTGDAANLSLTVITDGVAAAYSGDITEVDDGEYSVVVTQAGTLQSVSGVSSTSGAIVVPARWQNAKAVGAVTITSGGTNLVDGDLQIEVPRGDSYNLVVEAEDDAGDAIDLSCYDDFTFTVKPRSARSDDDDANAAFQVAGSVSGAGNNVLTFAITPTHTEACDLEVWYDCDIEAANTARTLVRTVAVGRYMTTLDVTRGASS